MNYKLFDGWSYRLDSGTVNHAGETRHMHLFKGKQKYTQHDDGSPKHKPKGGSGPTKRVKKELKMQTNWDWAGKEKEWLNKIEVTMDESGVFLVQYPSGDEMYYSGLVPYLQPSEYEIINGYLNNSNNLNENSGIMVFTIAQPIVVPQLLPTPIWIPAF